MLVLMSTIALYLTPYLKEQLEVRLQHFLCRIRTKGYSYSAAHLTLSRSTPVCRGTPIAEHCPRENMVCDGLCLLQSPILRSFVKVYHIFYFYKDLIELD